MARTTVHAAFAANTSWPRRAIRAILVGLVVASIAAVAAVTGASDAPSAAQIQPVDVHLTAEQQAQWQRLTATPAGRAEILDGLRAVFGRVATIGVGAAPGQIKPVGYTTGGNLRPEWAAGLTGDHFWITASYADIASGAIWGAVAVCKQRVPTPWLCDTAGSLLTSWARGWGWANNHGVWAAVYWWPPHVTGGRW
jgi:hypothetical protein